MCGIFGVITKNPPSPERFQKALKKIEHRGPDGEGVESFRSGDWTLLLGHRRLSILDLAGGQQPLLTDDRRSGISFNGEIYNYLDLRRRLPETPWKTKSDTEVALYHLLKHGMSGLLDFDGFFGLALWNANLEKLFVARDRWGIKPLYYRKLADGGVAFASEIGPLLELQGGNEKLSAEALEEYLFFDAPIRNSIIEGISQLAPGQGFVWKDGKIQIDNYFRWESQNFKKFAPTKAEAPEQLWHHFKKAVKSSFVSDVPVGLLLSGGVDSTLVSLAAAEEFGSGLPAFSIGFEEKTFDESGFAATVAKKIKADLHVKILSSQMMLDRLDDLLDRLESPLADPSFLPTTLLCELAGSKVKVAIGGDGGDELFWGYPTYWAHGVSEKIRSFPGAVGMGTWVAEHSRVKPGYQSFGWKMKRLFGRWDKDPMTRHLRWMSGTDLPEIEELRGQKLDFNLKHQFARELKIAADQDFAYPWLDLQLYLPGSVLAKVDRASMSCGLEVRPPFLSNEFANWALSLPADLKLQGKTGKWVLREALKKKVPQEILVRPKHGFAIPLYAWLLGPLKPRVEKILQESPLWDTKLLDPQRARLLWADLLSGKKDLQKTFWALLVLDHWLKKNSSYLRG